MGETMAVKTGTRIPLADLEQIVSKALAQGDYEHSTDWIDGHPVEVPTPSAYVVTLDILVSALPEPDTDLTLDKQQAATSILSVIKQRLSGEYILRASSLVKRLKEQAEIYELAHAVPVADESPSWLPRCAYCGQPCKDKRARYCSGSHRQQAYKKRKRKVTVG